MKQILLSLFCLLISINCFSQDTVVFRQALTKGLKAKHDSATQDDKRKFNNYFNAIANLVQEDSSSALLVNASLYSIFKIFKTDTVANDSIFAKGGPTRNTQLNLGVTPQTQTTDIKNSIKSVQAGVTYAIINNKTFSKKYLNKAINEFKLKQAKLHDVVQQYLADKATETERTDIAADIDSKTIDKLPDDLIEYLKQNLDFIKNLDDIKAVLLIDTNALYTQLANRLKSKPLFTVSCNSYYDDLNDRWKNIDFSSNFSFFPFAASNSGYKKTSISVKGTYSIQNDTLDNEKPNENSNLSRNTLNTSLDCNVPFNLWAKRTLLEIKPAFTYAHIYSGAYSGEEIDKFTGKVTFNFDLTKNISVPVAIVYDIKKPEFFGFLSLQYSL